ncbi:MAG: VWA domain-containing protein [Acidobacteriota bacterium]|nr:VWA domain-containing protein [Acidobacteriota bacterium]
MPTHRHRPLLSLAVLAASLAASAVAQDAASQPPAITGQNGTYQLQIQVDKLLVPVVVRDKQGNEVTDLTAQDFVVTDNGKARPLSGFTIERHLRTVGGGTAAAQSSAASAASLRVLLVLLDDLHLAPSEVVRAREATSAMLHATLDRATVAAVVTLSGRVNSVLTNNVAVLDEALAKVSSQQILRGDTSDCPTLDYYEADQVENKHNTLMQNALIQSVFNCNRGMDGLHDTDIASRLVDGAAQRMMVVGHQDVQNTLSALTQIVSRIATLPGQHTIVLVSPGFMTIENDTLAQESRLIDLAVRSNLTLNTLDARGLYTTAYTASEAAGSMQGSNFIAREEAHGLTTTLAENPLSEVANGTGGKFFHNSNDLAGGLRALVEPPACLYLLELPMDTVKKNGAYHRLKVTLKRPGLNLEARQGYSAPKAVKGEAKE